jgi:hypothetical protein
VVNGDCVTGKQAPEFAILERRHGAAFDPQRLELKERREAARPS